jgi:beta-glucanase (GH16 family)
MKQLFYNIIVLVFMLFVPLNNIISQVQGDANWNQTAFFSDDFSTPNRTWPTFVDNQQKWWSLFTASGVLHGIKEHQVYQKQQCVFNDEEETIRLVAKYVGGPMGCNDFTYPDWYNCDTSGFTLYYFSGALEAFDISFLYGLFEIKCKLPIHKGAFPAFWLWGGGSNHYEEIDIFEYFWKDNFSSGGYQYSFTTGHYFNDTSSHLYWENDYSRNYPVIENSLANWNTFSCEWSPQRIIWYCNGEMVNQYIGNKVPYRPMVLMANYALNDEVIKKDKTPYTEFFPDEMVIDYIKVNKLKCDCNDTVVIETNSDLNSYDYSVKNNISFISNGNNIVLPSNTKSVFRATNYILIDKGFELPSNTEFEVIIHSCPE